MSNRYIDADDARGLAGAFIREPIDYFLSQCCGGKNGSFVRPEHGQPVGYIGRMVESRLKSNAKVGTKEGGADFGNQFFPSIGFVAEAFTEIAITAMLGRGPVDLMPISA